jgi:eukaryotic-like serine/threonine-protein kinase
MILTLDEFRIRLVDAKLVTSDELEQFLGGLDSIPENPRDLAKLLIKSGKLTKYQAQQVARNPEAELVLGNYVILDKIGSGGMGDVYLAEHRKMSRRVALKILPGGAERADSSIHRFQREVRAAARLSHPNIVTAFDADEVDGKYYFAMEYVAGRDLSSWVKKNGRLQVPQVVDIIRQAARGLAYAHEQGVIHRDIKPANLLWDQQGNVKILDMGLARFTESPLGVDEASALTQSGTIMGTVDYMSPEQALDTRTAGPPSDVYSLGCTLFYLLAGRPMFIEETVMKRLMAKQSQSPPPLANFRDDVPSRLEAVYQKMVSSAMEQRYQSMEQVIQALDSISDLEETRVENRPKISKPSESRDESPSERTVASSDVTRAVKSDESETDPNTMQVSIQAQTDSRLTRAKTRSASRHVPLIAGLIGISCLGLIAFLVLRGGGNDGIDSASKPSNVELAENTSERHNPDASSPAKGETASLDPSPALPPIVADQAGATEPNSTKTPLSFSLSENSGAWNLKFDSAEPLVAEVPEEILAASRASDANRRAGEPNPHAFRIEPTSKRPPRLLKTPFPPPQAQKAQKDWAKHLGLDVTYENSLGMKFQLIPPGEFEMGFAEDRLRFLKSEFEDFSTLAEQSAPQQSVRLTRPYYLASTETTQKQFLELMGFNPSMVQPGEYNEHWLLGRDHLTFPVDKTNWFHAVEFCNRLSRRESLTPCYRIEEKHVELVPDADGYRLPTSAEWEFAALAGNEGFFWFGDPPNLANTPPDKWKNLYGPWIVNFEWIAQQPVGQNPVGTLKPNPFGLFDMHGNLDEWCWDWFHMYTENREVLIDPAGPESGTAKVVRGGASVGGAYQLPKYTGPFRIGLAREGKTSRWPGFRVIRVIPQPAPEDRSTAQPQVPAERK